MEGGAARHARLQATAVNGKEQTAQDTGYGKQKGRKTVTLSFGFGCGIVKSAGWSGG